MVPARLGTPEGMKTTSTKCLEVSVQSTRLELKELERKRSPELKTDISLTYLRAEPESF